MNKRLLVIFNVGDEDDVCRLFMPYWKRSGCDILFSSPVDNPSRLERVLHLHTGLALDPVKRATWWKYQARVLATMEDCLYLDYEGYIFTQYDSICLGVLPEIRREDCVHHVFGNNDPNYAASYFVHPPWCFGREQLVRFTRAARNYPIEAEHGVMDRWMAWIMEREKFVVTPSNDWSHSVNSYDTPGRITEGREAIFVKGVRFIHGVKSAVQLNQLLAA